MKDKIYEFNRMFHLHGELNISYCHLPATIGLLHKLFHVNKKF